MANKQLRGKNTAVPLAKSITALEVCGWSAPRPGRFSPGKNLETLVLEAGWSSGLIWKGSKNITHTGALTPDRPAPSLVHVPISK